MAHNVSPRMRHDRVMKSRLSDWPGHFLSLRCDGPGHPGYFLQDPIEAFEAHRAGMTVLWWAQQLTCSACGRTFAPIALRRQDRPGTFSPRDWFTEVVGPGKEQVAARQEAGDLARYEWWRDVPWLQETTPRSRRRR